MTKALPSAPRLTRRRFLVGSGLGLAAAGGLVEGILLEPNRLSVSSHVLGTERPDALLIRLAVLADLHLKSISDLHERIAHAIEQAEPDVVLLVGDSIDSAANLPLLSDFLRLLPHTGRRVATLGNWEHWSRVDLSELRRVYEGGETELLVNEGIDVGGGRPCSAPTTRWPDPPTSRASRAHRATRPSCSATVPSSGTRYPQTPRA